jgi:hypothetical protein
MNSDAKLIAEFTGIRLLLMHIFKMKISCISSIPNLFYKFYVRNNRQYIKYSFFLFGALFLFSPSFGQRADSLKNPLNIGIRSYYGFIIPHSDKIADISYSKPWGIDIDLSWLLLGNKAWDYCFCYPRLGISFSYTNFANPRIIGNAYSIIGIIEPFLSYSKRINFSYRAGLGISYLNNPYDSIRNPRNYFFGSHLSFVALLNFSLNYRINDRWNSKVSAFYSHISNGGIQEPNLGINYPTISFGLDYMLSPYQLQNRPRTKKELYPKEFSVFLTSFASGKTLFRSEKKRYPVIGLSAEASQVVGRVSALSFGAEWVADYTLRELNKRNGSNNDYNRIAILAGHQMLIGRFIFSQKLGIYVYSPVKAMDPVYQRYGLIFKISSHLFTGIDIKAHRYVADILDFRIGLIL